MKGSPTKISDTGEVIFCKSNKVILRGGYANAVVFPATASIAIAIASASDSVFPYVWHVFLGLCLGAFWFWLYSRAVARIAIVNGSVTGVTPLGTFAYGQDRIEGIKMSGIPSSKTGTIVITLRDKKIPVFLYWIAPRTDFGTFSETLSHLKMKFEQRETG